METCGAGEMAQRVGRLLHKIEDLGSDSQSARKKPGEEAIDA